MSKRNALRWAQALWALWNETVDGAERLFYSRMATCPAAALGVKVSEKGK